MNSLIRPNVLYQDVTWSSYFINFPIALQAMIYCTLISAIKEHLINVDVLAYTIS